LLVPQFAVGLIAVRFLEACEEDTAPPPEDGIILPPTSRPRTANRIAVQGGRESRFGSGSASWLVEPPAAGQDSTLPNQAQRFRLEQQGAQSPAASASPVASEGEAAPQTEQQGSEGGERTEGKGGVARVGADSTHEEGSVSPGRGESSEDHALPEDGCTRELTDAAFRTEPPPASGFDAEGTIQRACSGPSDLGRSNDVAADGLGQRGLVSQGPGVGWQRATQATELALVLAILASNILLALGVEASAAATPWESGALAVAARLRMARIGFAALFAVEIAVRLAALSTGTRAESGSRSAWDAGVCVLELGGVCSRS